MKKLITFLILVVILLCGCVQSDNGTIMSGTETNNQGIDFTEQHVPNSEKSNQKIDIYKQDAVIGIGMSSIEDKAATINLFFIVSDKTEFKKYVTEIEQEKKKIQLLMNDEHVFETISYSWSTDVQDQYYNARLEIKLDDLAYKEVDKLEFNSIVLPDLSEEPLQIGKYILRIDQTAPYNEIAVVESPIGLDHFVKNGEPFKVSYKVMFVQKFNYSELLLNIEIDDYIDIITVEDVVWKLNEGLTKEYKAIYSDIKSKDEIRDLRVYDVDVIYRYSGLNDGIIQPFIVADIDGQRKYSAIPMPLAIMVDK